MPVLHKTHNFNWNERHALQITRQRCQSSICHILWISYDIQLISSVFPFTQEALKEALISNGLSGTWPRCFGRELHRVASLIWCANDLAASYTSQNQCMVRPCSSNCIYKWNTFATSIGQASSTMSAHILQSWIIIKRCQVSHIYPTIGLPPFMSGFLLHSFHKGMEWLFCRMGPDHFGPCRLLSFVSNCSHMELIIGPHESFMIILSGWHGLFGGFWIADMDGWPIGSSVDDLAGSVRPFEEFLTWSLISSLWLALMT